MSATTQVHCAEPGCKAITELSSCIHSSGQDDKRILNDLHIEHGWTMQKSSRRQPSKPNLVYEFLCPEHKPKRGKWVTTKTTTGRSTRWKEEPWV